MKNKLLEETISDLKEIETADGMENGADLKLQELICKLENFDLTKGKVGSRAILKQFGEHLLKVLVKTAPLIIDEIIDSI